MLKHFRFETCFEDVLGQPRQQHIRAHQVNSLVAARSTSSSANGLSSDDLSVVGFDESLIACSLSATKPAEDQSSLGYDQLAVEVVSSAQ